MSEIWIPTDAVARWISPLEKTSDTSRWNVLDLYISCFANHVEAVRLTTNEGVVHLAASTREDLDWLVEVKSHHLEYMQ